MKPIKITFCQHMTQSKYSYSKDPNCTNMLCQAGPVYNASESRRGAIQYTLTRYRFSEVVFIELWLTKCTFWYF